MKTILRIDPAGLVQTMSTPDAFLLIEALGSPVLTRASHVWPRHWFKRSAFRSLRFVFGEIGRVACWCRTWRGPWEVRFANRPERVVFWHPSRRVCIRWEVWRLNDRLVQG